MQRENKQLSLTQRQINDQIQYIYTHLIKLGYPKILQIYLSSISQIQSYLAAYFQSTSSRLQLIQWLIALVFPEYRQMQWYIAEKDPLNKIIKCLWKVGVMSVNKHTKNLDYKKYVQATFGYQNAVSLIYSLVQLAYETILVKKSKNDVSFGQFFHQLVQNYTQLVNQNYDVYGITFPSKFINLNKIRQNNQNQDDESELLDEFQKQYDEFYQQKMLPLLERQDEIFEKIYAKNKKPIEQVQNQKKKSLNNDQSMQINSLQHFIQELSRYGRQYSQKYNMLVRRIDELLSTVEMKSRLIPYYLSKNQQNQSAVQKQSVKDSIEKRSIKISPSFCKKYQNYKRILKQIKFSKDDQSFFDQRSDLLERIVKINDQISI